jgi:hypothetical protein
VSDTPETDHVENNLGNCAHPVLSSFCRKLERERNEWKAAHDNMEKTVEDYQKEIIELQNELKYCKNNNDIQSDVLKRQWGILDKTLFELPVGYITNHTYENIPSRVEYYVEAHSILEKESEAKDELIEKLRTEKAKAVNDHLLLQVYAEEDAETLQSLEKAIKTHYDYYKGFAAKKHLSSVEMLDALFSLCNHVDSKENEHLVNDNRKLHGELAKLVKRINDADAKENERDHYKAEESARYKAALDENEYLLEQLEALKDKSRLFKSAQDGQEYLRCLHQRGNKHQSVGLWVEDAVAYKAALEEIVKRPRKSETCKLIAQQALGLLSDDDYQPELLMEENLALKMKIEDLQAVIDSKLLNKVFPDKVNPLMSCHNCGEYWDYHHEQHCKANSLPPLQNNDA